LTDNDKDIIMPVKGKELELGIINVEDGSSAIPRPDNAQPAGRVNRGGHFDSSIRNAPIKQVTSAGEGSVPREESVVQNPMTVGIVKDRVRQIEKSYQNRK
jgi:hypothetical protein